ncbi:MAG: hypothetical protein JSS32_00480 [Verrucomicrobia bacterium]|nr:hypothetical protein [Verrucomicrobiota bacterium]
MRDDSEEIRFFSFRDVRWLFRRKKRWIYRCAAVGICFGALLVFAKGPKYQIEATFKEAKEKTPGDDLMKELIMGMSASSSPESSSFMKSYAVLRPLIEELGLQATVVQKTLFSKLVFRFIDTLKAEFGVLLDDQDLFRFRNVKYEGELPYSVEIKFSDAEQFDVWDQEKWVTQGRVGSAVSLEKVRFTVAQTPLKLRLQKRYKVAFAPWIKTSKQLRDSISISSAKTNKTLYQLVYPTRDRIGGAKIVNGLMVQFQRYLKGEYDDFAQQQMVYLGQRQKEAFSQFEGALKEHASFLSQKLGEDGFMTIAQEVQMYVEPFQKMTSKLLALDLDLHRLEEGSLLSENTGSMQKLLASIQDLQRQRDLLEISVSQSLIAMNEPFEIQRRELEVVREKRNRVLDLQKQLDGEITLSFDPDPMIASWASRIQQSQLASGDRKDFADYLSNWARLLSMREKILQERFLHKGTIPPEFEGIDLDTSRALFVAYNNRLDQSEATIRHISKLKEQIKQPSFEIGSLSGVLTDAVSQSLISQAAQINFQLKDEKYCSTKEGERWRDELSLKRNLLDEHLSQLLDVEKSNSDLTREKIFALQQVGLDCINRQISVLQEQIKEDKEKKIADLHQEKKLVLEQMKEIRSHLGALPEKWHSEILLEIKSKMHQKIIGAVAELVESKTIGHHLHHVGSKPLDLSIPPVSPMKPGLVLFMFLGGFLVGFGAFFISFIQAVLRGFPMNGEKLRALKWPFSGELSPFCDGPSIGSIGGSDLEAIRRLILFADAAPKAQVLALIGGQGPDFSYALAEVSEKMGRKVCLVRCDFEGKFQESEQPGLLQALEGKSLKIREGKGYDWIPTGGYSRFGSELIQSPKFKEIVESLREKYDLILLCFRSPLHFAESSAALGICDKAAVTVKEEQIESLTPFASWAYHEGCCRLTFLASEVP